jgi:hypothetical protein
MEGRMDVSFDIKTDGPLFDGMAISIIGRYVRHVEDALGDEGVTRIRAYLPTQYMYLGHHGGTPEFNPVPPNAGYYQSQIHTERQVADAVIITDTPVVYGPWLEGVSERNMIVFPHRRNPPPRRFPGYHTFRVIAQTLNDDAVEIAERELQPYLMEMNT